MIIDVIMTKIMIFNSNKNVNNTLALMTMMTISNRNLIFVVRRREGRRGNVLRLFAFLGMKIAQL